MYRCGERSSHGMTWQVDWPTWSSEFSLDGNPNTLSRDTTQGSPWLTENFACGESNSCGPLPITATLIKQSKV